MIAPLTASLTEEEIALRHWQEHPENFIEDVLGIQLWSKQIEILHSIRDHTRTAVKSCNSAGKTEIAATALLWALYTHRDSIVLTTASSGRQVKNQIWRRVRRMYNRAKTPLGGRLLKQELHLDDEWYAIGFSTDDQERVSGYHAPFLLFIIDEPGLIDEDVMGAIEGILASGNARLLMIGNPTQDEGAFYEAFHQEAENYHAITISAFDTPNLEGLVPADLLEMDEATLQESKLSYLISRQWVQSRLRSWGEESLLWAVRVLGEFPGRGGNRVFPLDLIERSIGGKLESSVDEKLALGIDVARHGTDHTGFATLAFGGMADLRRGELLGLEEWQETPNTMMIANYTKQQLETFPAMVTAIDDIGLGSGPTDRLFEMGFDPLPFLAGTPAPDAPYADEGRYRQMYADVASWSYWTMREAMQDGRLVLRQTIKPEALDNLIQQLVGITYKFTSAGKIKIEKKGEEGTGKSPDLADAFAIAWWGAWQENETSGGTAW